MGMRRWCKAAWNRSGVSAASKGSGPSRCSNLAAGAACMPGDHTTAPNRRGSFSRRVPWLVTRSKWSWAPGGGGSASKASEPDMPRCINNPPSRVAMPVAVNGSHRYLPRRSTGPTVLFARSPGGTPKGQRKGLPKRAEITRAPRNGVSIPRLVTSTSGSSGIASLCENGIALPGSHDVRFTALAPRCRRHTGRNVTGVHAPVAGTAGHCRQQQAWAVAAGRAAFLPNPCWRDRVAARRTWRGIRSHP